MIPEDDIWGHSRSSARLLTTFLPVLLPLKTPTTFTSILIGWEKARRLSIYIRLLPIPHLYPDLSPSVALIVADGRWGDLSSK